MVQDRERWRGIVKAAVRVVNANEEDEKSLVDVEISEGSIK